MHLEVGVTIAIIITVVATVGDLEVEVVEGLIFAEIRVEAVVANTEVDLEAAEEAGTTSEVIHEQMLNEPGVVSFNVVVAVMFTRYSCEI